MWQGIFAACIPLEPVGVFDAPLSAPFTLLGVCKQWYNVCLDYGHLWSRICIDEHFPQDIPLMEENVH